MSWWNEVVGASIMFFGIMLGWIINESGHRNREGTKKDGDGSGNKG